MNQDKVNKLKDLLLHSDHFGQIGEYYMDHFAEHEAFIDQSKEHTSTMLELMLKSVTMQLVNYTPVVLRDHIMLDVPHLGIMHGGFQLERQIGSYFYISSINRGMLMVSEFTGMTQFALIVPANKSGEALPPNFIDNITSAEPIARIENPN